MTSVTPQSPGFILLTWLARQMSPSCLSLHVHPSWSCVLGSSRQASLLSGQGCALLPEPPNKLLRFICRRTWYTQASTAPDTSRWGTAGALWLSWLPKKARSRLLHAIVFRPSKEYRFFFLSAMGKLFIIVRNQTTLSYIYIFRRSLYLLDGEWMGS